MYVQMLTYGRILNGDEIGALTENYEIGYFLFWSVQSQMSLRSWKYIMQVVSMFLEEEMKCDGCVLGGPTTTLSLRGSLEDSQTSEAVIQLWLLQWKDTD